MRLRPYTSEDLETVVGLWFASWQSTGMPSPVTQEDLRARLPKDLKIWTVHVATIGDEITGFIAYHDDHLSQLFVAPSHQNKGIGKRMLDFAKEKMPDGFYLTTALESDACRFYTREGLMPGEIATHPFGHKIIRYDWNKAR